MALLSRPGRPSGMYLLWVTFPSGQPAICGGPSTEDNLPFGDCYWVHEKRAIGTGSQVPTLGIKSVKNQYSEKSIFRKYPDFQKFMIWLNIWKFLRNFFLTFCSLQIGSHVFCPFSTYSIISNLVSNEKHFIFSDDAKL